MKNLLSTLLFFATIPLACTPVKSQDNPRVRTGAEMLIENYLYELEGYRIGLVMNPTARVQGVHVLDTLLALEVNVTALFAPEHGFRGKYSDGEVIEDGIDQQSGIQVFSLYGSNKRPTEEMLAEVDILLFDMQDVGARFYTYNTTMRYVIEEATRYGKEVWILDRPNPAGGEYVSGWVLEPEFESMVGSHPIPVAHGLTLGELSKMAIKEGWYDVTEEPSVKVIEMEGWKRNMLWPDTGLEWVPPSPNLPSFAHAYVYLGTCFFEGTTLSEGRGTENPFLTVGAPGTHVDLQILDELGSAYHSNIDTVSFTPVSIPGKSLYPKYQDQLSKGVYLQPKKNFNQPVEFGVELIKIMMDFTDDAEYKDYLNLLAGTKKLQNEDGFNWGNEFEEFLEKRQKYLLYN
ncbi:MAG: DUF1343 domain-containing protein [Balneolales bacterium]|nr:DUF1343 domain-containing protein [Balneolales bacterium]